MLWILLAWAMLLGTWLTLLLRVNWQQDWLILPLLVLFGFSAMWFGGQMSVYVVTRSDPEKPEPPRAMVDVPEGQWQVDL